MLMRKLIKQRISDGLARMDRERAEFDRKYAEVSEEIRWGKGRMEKAALNRRLIRN